MSFFHLFRQDRGDWSVESLAAPWPADRSSILEGIRCQVPLEGSQCRLPDEEYVRGPGGTRFIAGLHDNIIQVHDSPGDLEHQVESITRALRRVVASGSQPDLQRFYDTVVESRIANALPAIGQIVSSELALEGETLVRLGRWLAANAPDRDAVKLGIVLIGTTDGQVDNDLLLELAGHEEFTDVALASFYGTSEEVQSAAFTTAKRTAGWGRLAAVRRLDGSADPTIREWLLRNGHLLQVYGPTPEALLCARTGGLAEALAADDIETDTLIAYAGLFSDLLWEIDAGRPYLSDYDRGLDAGMSLIRHLKQANSDIRLWETIFLIRGHFEDEPDLTWREKEIESFVEGLDQFLRRRDWPILAERVLATGEDAAECFAALRAANEFGFSAFEHVLRWLREGYPFASLGLVFRQADSTSIDTALEFAAQRIGMDSLPGSPTLSLFVPYADERQQAIDSTVHELERFPGKGWHFIRIQLSAPGRRARITAVKTLEEWPRSHISGSMRSELRAIAVSEPDSELKARMLGL